MKIIDVQDLVVNYGYISALAGIDFHVNENEIVTLIGANGAGKTTSLMTISGYVKAKQGRIIYKGKDISHLPAHKIAGLGIAHVPEGRQIFADLTVEENLNMGFYSNRQPIAENRKVRFQEVYDLFPRLYEREKQYAGTLSGGEQQMLAIGRGMMMDPDLLILDEPSLGLAPILVKEIFELIKKIQKLGRTILLVEQNAAMSLAIADRGYVLENGRIVLSDTGANLLANTEVKAAYLGGACEVKS